MIATLTSWMGGSRPAKPTHTPSVEYTLASILFRDALHDFADYWHEMPDRDTLRTLYRRARFDAHASFRSNPQLH
jgi:hypothetical protein